MAGEKTRVVMTKAPGIRALPHPLGYEVTQHPESVGVRPVAFCLLRELTQTSGMSESRSQPNSPV